MHRVHFIGVGGYSMSGLAVALKAQGLVVTGSDARSSARTRLVEAAGIPVAIGHRADNVGSADTVVYTSDVPDDNVERAAAVQRGLRVLHRSEILNHLLTGRRPILITGTAGKTTTTSMTGLILHRAGKDPLILAGGEMRDLDGQTVVLGRGPWVVAETDESDGSFLRYRPEVAVVTNLEPEHLDHYGGRFENLQGAMQRFLETIPGDGIAILGADDAGLRALGATLPVPTATFGFHESSEWRGRDIREDPAGTDFEVVRDGKPIGRGWLPVPGLHNVQNALAAIAASERAGVPIDEALDILRGFVGAKRRFETVGTARGVRIVDDYAHHPSKMRAAVQAAHQLGGSRVVAAFQPQRYMRTAQLWDQFVEVLGDADLTVVSDIYGPPGEPPIDGVTSERLVAAARQAHPGAAIHYAPSLDDVVEWLTVRIQPGDVVLTMGAGDIWRAAQALYRRLAP
jgi:UDP-N-acetylmuramate--alanine ligase